MDIQTFETALIEARDAMDEYHALHAMLGDAEDQMNAAFENFLDSCTELLLDDPVEFLNTVDAKSLRKVLYTARSLDRMNIFEKTEHIDLLPHSNGMYYRSYPGSASERLWNAAQTVEPVLGFRVYTQHNLQYRERNGREFVTAVYLTANTNEETVYQHCSLFQKVLHAVQETLQENEVLRVWEPAEDIVAEYRETGGGIALWFLYDPISISAEQRFLDTRSGEENPLDFLQSIRQVLKEKF